MELTRINTTLDLISTDYPKFKSDVIKYMQFIQNKINSYDATFKTLLPKPANPDTVETK